MTLEEAYEKRRQEVLSLKRQLNKAEKIIGELTAGTYVDSEKAEHLRTINRLSQEVKHLNNKIERFKGWYSQQSGQFVSQKYSEYFADIRTYIETCYRNGINWFKALRRLTASNPYTLAEVLGEA